MVAVRTPLSIRPCLDDLLVCGLSCLDRVVTIPVLLAALGRMARLTMTNLVAVIGFSILWALALLLATLTQGPGRWAAYVYGDWLALPGYATS